MDTNCPNCGAPITSYRCEYCGTKFESPLENELKTRIEYLNFRRKQDIIIQGIIGSVKPQYILSGYNDEK